MTSREARRPTVEDVVAALKSLRPYRGITVERVIEATALHSLPAVIAEAPGLSRVARVEAVYALLLCVLEKDHTLPQQVRDIVGLELNLREDGSTLTARQLQARSRLEMYGADYDTASNRSYLLLAQYLLATLTIPCGTETNIERELAAAQELQIRTAEALLAQALALLLFSTTRADAERHAIDVLRRLPNAEATFGLLFSTGELHALDARGRAVFLVRQVVTTLGPWMGFKRRLTRAILRFLNYAANARGDRPLATVDNTHPDIWADMQERHDRLSVEEVAADVRWLRALNDQAKVVREASSDLALEILEIERERGWRTILSPPPANMTSRVATPLY